MALRARRHIKHKIMADINVVPYIDVMLVLLVIFMITTPLMKQGVEVDLPSAKANKIDPKAQKPIIVTVNKDGDYYLNESETAISAKQLMIQVAAEHETAKSKSVYVRGDKNANYGQVLQAMVLIQKAGISKVGLMTEDKNANR